MFPWSYNPGLSAAVALAKLVKNRDIPTDIIVQHVKSLIRNQKTVLHWVLNKFFEKAFKRQSNVNKITIWNFMEQMPNADNRVVLSNERDRLGCRKVRVSWTIGDLDKHTMVVLHQLLQKHLRAYGIGELDSPLLENNLPEWPINIDSSHHMGTTRMGTALETSVVDKNCKIHSMDNLYIAGSSVFPTSGYANPTATLTAFAIRLSDYIKKSFN